MVLDRDATPLKDHTGVHGSLFLCVLVKPKLRVSNARPWKDKGIPGVFSWISTLGKDEQVDSRRRGPGGGLQVFGKLAASACAPFPSPPNGSFTDHSTPAALRTREKVSRQQHLTGAALDLKEKRIPATEFDPPRGKEKILRKCLWHRLRSHGPRWN